LVEDGQQGVAAVERALNILAAWRHGENNLALRDLHRRTGLYKSTILRLLASLERHHCVIRHADGTWALGPMTAHWGTIYRHGLDVNGLVCPVLNRLIQVTGEDVEYWALEGDRQVLVCNASTKLEPRREVPTRGERRSLEDFASGLVLSRGIQQKDRDTVALRENAGAPLTSIAAPIYGAGDKLYGAITVVGPKPRVWPQVDRLKSLVSEAAKDLSSTLGVGLLAN